jgi:hypothetical protein
LNFQELFFLFCIMDFLMPKMKPLDSTVVDPVCKFAIKYRGIIFNGDIFDQSIYLFENSKCQML